MPVLTAEYVRFVIRVSVEGIQQFAVVAAFSALTTSIQAYVGAVESYALFSQVYFGFIQP